MGVLDIVFIIVTFLHCLTYVSSNPIVVGNCQLKFLKTFTNLIHSLSIQIVNVYKEIKLLQTSSFFILCQSLVSFTRY